MHETEVALKAESNELLGLADELDMAGSTPQFWTGDAGQAASRRLHELRDDIEDAVAQLAAVRRAVGEAGDWIEDLTRRVSEVEELASRNSFVIPDSFTMQSWGLGGVVDLERGQQGGANRLSIRDDLEVRAKAILRLAGEIDGELIEVLERTRSGEIGEDGASSLTEADRLGRQQGALFHFELLDQYQVAPDPDGMTAWRPGGPAGWAWERLPGNEPLEMTAGEARMLQDLQDRQGLSAVQDAKDARQDAIHRAENVFDGTGLTDGHSDAWRHAYWNAQMTQRFGEEWAADFATAHERNPTSHPTPVAMDLHNNEVGRRIAMEHPDAGPEQLQELIKQAVLDGEMVVIGPDDRLVPSNELGLGDTRATSANNPWPETHLEREDHHDPGPPGAEPER